jgi:5'-nucleotidase
VNQLTTKHIEPQRGFVKIGLSTLSAIAISSGLVAACGGSSGSAISVNGVAATGAAIVNKPVSVVCASGTGTATTNASGGYTVTVMNGAFPCLIEVNTGTARLHSIALSAANTNVTPLTEALVGQFASDTAAYFTNFSSTVASSLTPASIASAQSAVFAALTANGITIPATVTDLLGGKLTPAVAGSTGNDYDKLLDTTAAQSYTVKMIAINDFHGNFQLTSTSNGGAIYLPNPSNPAGTKVTVGGAAYLATVVKNLKASAVAGNSIVVGAGDMISASPFASSITHDEATVDILNQIGLEVTSVGNHEFDRGMTELQRIQNGGCYPAGGTAGVVGQDTCLVNGLYPGASYKYLSANVVNTSTGTPLFAATYIKHFGPVSVGFIGLTFQGTPGEVTASGVANLSFKEESGVINTYAKTLKSNGVDAVVVLIHQGGQTTATTINDKTCPGFSGDITPILDKLSSDVDVVVSGHTHQEYVCQYTGAASGKSYLLTSTGYYGGAVSDINLTIKPGVGVTSANANTVPVIRADDSANLAIALPAGFSGVSKDAAVDALVTKYTNLSATLAQQTVGTISASINRALLSNVSTPTRDETSEGAMGDVIADTYLAGVVGGADVAFMNPGGVRADLTCTGNPPCNVTYSALNTVEPFGNTLVTLNLTGAQILRLLENQWEAPNNTAKTNAVLGRVGRILQVSNGFTYSFHTASTITANVPDCAGKAQGSGSCLVAGSVKLNGVAIDPAKSYKVVTNNYLAGGGDNFPVMATGANIHDTKITDLAAGIQYFTAHSPVSPPAPRITSVP